MTLIKPLTVFTILTACSSGAALAQERTERTFSSPDAAAQALIDAASKNDSAQLAAVLGSGSKHILTSGDSGRDEAERKEFAQLATARHKLEPSSMRTGTMILLVGDQDWPFPVPIIQEDQRWRFDSGLGSLEIRARRVGANELDAIEICSGYVEAQQAYAAEHRDYARSIRNGLYQPGSPDALVPQGFASAAMESPARRATPYHGYYFRVLTAQGSNAPGGPHNYVAGKSMIGGFALVAWPAEYGVTGVHTFIVNQDDTVYEKDLGAQTSMLAPAIVRYDPDSSWTLVD